MSNKIYFSEYLPVEGDIKRGSNQLIWKEGIFSPVSIDKMPKSTNEIAYQREGYRVVKLFLCSRDIQVGDKVCDVNDNSIFADVVGVNGTKIYAKLDGKACILHNTGGIMKIIGEISPDATWVTRGMKFDETEIQKCIWSVPDFYTDEKEMIPVQTDKWFNSRYNREKGKLEPIPLERKVIQIKGPCGHFH